VPENKSENFHFIHHISEADSFKPTVQK